MLGKVSVQLMAEQRKSLPGKAGLEDRSGVGWPRSAWGLPASHPNLPPTTYPGPTFQGLCGWAVGTQMLCQVANAGETETAARAGAGYLLSCRMHTARSPVPSPPTLSRALPQKGIYEAGITL